MAKSMVSRFPVKIRPTKPIRWKTSDLGPFSRSHVSSDKQKLMNKKIMKTMKTRYPVSKKSMVIWYVDILFRMVIDISNENYWFILIGGFKHFKFHPVWQKNQPSFGIIISFFGFKEIDETTKQTVYYIILYYIILYYILYYIIL